MKSMRFFSYAAPLFILPLLLISLSGCKTQEKTEENTSQVIRNVPVASATVLFPNGKELLEAGKPYEIRWNSEGVNTVNISLEENGYTRGVIAEGISANDEKYLWTPAFSDGTQDDHTMLLQLVLTNTATGKVLDMSDETFIIVKKTDK